MINSSTSEKKQFALRYLAGLRKCLDALSLDQIAALMDTLESAYQRRSQVFLVGNGGSAATASHMACDLGKNGTPREPGSKETRFRVMSLTDNVPWMTAVANDFGYEAIFSEQLKSLVFPDDLLIVISGSGGSPNILEAIKTAKSLGAQTFGILGFDGGQAKGLLDGHILVNSNHYGYIEDLHMIIDHLITDYFHG